MKIAKLASITTSMVVLIILAILGLIVYTGQQEVMAKTEPLRRTDTRTPRPLALIMIAEHEGLFAKHEVDVDLHEFTAGKFALQAFLGGSLDVAVAGDIPVGLALLQAQQFLIVGEVLKNSNGEVRMVIRNIDGCRGITPESYFHANRRTIATSFGGGPQYFTVIFLRAHNISLSDVRLISQKPEEMPIALQNGSVDGIAIFDPAAWEAENRLGGAHCTFHDPGAYRQHYVIVAREKDVKPNIDPRLKKFMAALRDAETFITTNAASAQMIVGEKTGLGSGKIAEMWDKYEFGVVLDPDLARLLKEEADWHRNQANAIHLAYPDYAITIDRSLIDAQ